MGRRQIVPLAVAAIAYAPELLPVRVHVQEEPVAIAQFDALTFGSKRGGGAA
jgi:hypothetical protein